MISLVLFGSLVVLLILNVPVSISLGIASLITILVSGDLTSGYIVQNLVTTLPRGTVSGIANASTVSGNLRNGTVTGTIGAGGGAPTDYTGSSETAPDHIYVRCLIRAKP